jgi:hypothetical protein
MRTSEEGGPVRIGRPRPTTRWVLVGIGLLQTAWILALPAFRGADEVDHVFRASAVAHGDWVSTPSAATIGTGAVVSVDATLVRAAKPACERLAYKAPGDCGPDEVRGERVDVPTASGRYNPAYYVGVGYIGSLADGVATVVVMRMVSAALCLALLGLVLVRLDLWSGPRRRLAVVVGVTPTMVYSTTLVAPNGLEMVAGVGFWLALAALARDDDPDHEVGHVVVGTVCGALLVTLRSMGPFWAVCIIVLSLVAWPALLSRLRSVAGTAVGKWALVVGLITGAASVAWVALQRSLVVGLEPSGEGIDMGFRIMRSLQEIPVWILQAIAAFPYRNQPAPLVVYPCFLVLLGSLVVVGLRPAPRRLRAAAALAMAVFILVPLAITLATIDVFGTAWQGRYALPLVVGVAVLAGDGWARAARRRSRRSLVVTLGLPLFLAVQVPGVVAVADAMRRTEAWVSGVGEVAHAPVWAVLVLALAGATACFLSPALEVHRQDR